MKKLTFALFLTILALTVSSCLNKDNDSDVTNIYEGMATVTSADEYPSFITDNGYKLDCSNEVSIDTGAVFVVGERVFLSYAFGDTTTHAAKVYPIVLKSFGKVDVKSYVSLEKGATDIYENQTLYSYTYFWTSGNYFNAVFYAFKPLSSTNSFELVRVKDNETCTAQDTLPTISLELRHNTSTVSDYYYYLQVYSFDLSTLVTEFPLAKRFKIDFSWKDLRNGSTSVDLTFDPHKTASLISAMKKGKPSFRMDNPINQSVVPIGF